MAGSAGVLAQIPGFQFQHLGKEEGLTNNTANYFISQDSRGFIWIGSLNGFYRYDGSRLRHYLIPQNPEDAFMPDQIIQSLFWEDDRGNLWFSTYNSLHCLLRATGKIVNYLAPDADGIKTDRSYHVFHYEPQADQLWLRAGDQVWTYHIPSGRWAAQFASQGIRYAVATGTDGALRHIIDCAWVKGPVGVHRRERNGGWRSEKFLHPELEIRSALLRSDSTAWLFARQGLLEFNFVNGALSGHWTHTPRGEPLNLIGGAYWQHGSSLLLATKGEGLLVFDERQGRITSQLKHDDNNPLSFMSDAPRGLLVSKDGQLWVGHESGGVDYSRIIQQGFSDLFASNGMAGSGIKGTAENGNGDILILTAAGNLLLSEKGSMRLTPVALPGRIGRITYLAAGDSDAFWVMSQTAIYRLKKNKSNAAQYVWEPIYDAGGGLVSVFPGIPGRTLVITTEGVFDLAATSGRHFLQPAAEFDAYKGFYFKHFYKLDDKTVLIPFESQTLWVAQLKEQKLVVTEQIDIGGDTYAACISPQGDSIWIATNLGLALYNRQQLTRVLGSVEAFNGADVLGVFPTQAGSLWLSTLNGLYRYNPHSKERSGFFRRDGLSGDQFLPDAGLRASDGRLWLGHDKGLAVFHPDSVQVRTPAVKTHIEALWVNNLPFAPPNLINETDTLLLGYRENTLSFELKAVNFHHAEANTLAYRLAGYDDTWNTVANGGFARFTKIPPGVYRLEILPKNANGRAGERRTMTICIRPPFWQTLWFKIASAAFVLALVAGAVGAYYRRKLRQQRALLERQQALHAERNRIAKELHDDMGSSLSSIRFLSEDLLLDDGETTPPELQRISHLAEKALENMREIIWAMDSDKNTLQDLAARLRTLATDLLSDNKIAFEMDIPAASWETITLGGERRRNIYLIAKEALHNVVKHAQASKVTVTMKLETAHLVLEIEDNGRGLPPEGEHAGGYGLGNMRGRAEAIGGELEIRSQPGKGVLLRLRAPLLR
jgi:signal transduction histidine kinase/ligand-binding sensor domain-containing protein